ncbi:DNA replication protein DnaD [Anaerocolumna cellulosilytica]|uniref:DNA replication protein DnaD n=1 Tax=Anaerocolumna cellulosilytica TaxID=433286 RepID=A0A6S6R054_9FIRM|nr:DnaD domain protein [Anaerocolumna cellulosilytica]MBB5196979.1 DnaD/phage-associated family protein [Anaerocolumna cellulosilytica]BCJ92621.1 DNA replication protein DnaD [Anaerocolumna cellulosilytica]
MSTIRVSSNSVPDTTLIPNIFIDNYMPSANGTYVKVYLYLLRCMNSFADIEITISNIADRLDETEKDIIRALSYWEKENLVTLTKNSKNDIDSITINNIYSTTHTNTVLSIEAEPAVVPTVSVEEYTMAESAATKTPSIPHRTFEKPTYSEAQIKQLTEADEVKWLLNIIEIYLERLIKPMDLQLILYLYESLDFSAELIMYLYEYCVSKNKKNPSYIEAVALSWAEEGIDTVEKAEAATTQYNNNYNAINKAFGLNRAPGQIEKQLISKWMNKFGFTIDIIVEACNRTILQTQKPDFKYADKILENWNKKGVKELSNIAPLDAEHQKLSAARAGQVKAAPQQKPANNRFNAFPQRTYTEEDYSSMEQRLLHKQ